MNLTRMNKDTIITVQNQKLRDDFLKTIEKIFKNNPSIAKYLKEIGGKSNTTYNHSVNVAFHVFERLKKDKNFSYSKEEIERWTEASLVHDIGKLKTPNEILHTTTKLSDGERCIMMRHSFEGFYIAKNQYNFSKECIGAIIGHHIDAKYLDGGVDRNFEGASKSRPQWSLEFEEGEIESILTENLSWATEKDIHALETISFCDVIEALRSKERSYQKQHDWLVSEKDNASIKDIVQTWDIDTTEKEALSKKFDGLVLDKNYQRQFDKMQEINVSFIVRDMVFEQTKDQKVRVSKDTLEEIKNNPEIGKMFAEKRTSKKDGQEYFVVHGKEDAGSIVFGSKTVPDLQSVAIKDNDILSEFEQDTYELF